MEVDIGVPAEPVFRPARVAEVLAVAGVGAALLFLSRRILDGVDGAADLATVGLALVVGLLLADLTSGLVHWWADRMAREDFPLLGPLFVLPFREHHEDPTGICRHDFFETNGNTCMVVLPFLGAACLSTLAAPVGRGALFASATFVALVVWSCLTNQIHKWAHLPRVPAAVHRLQQVRLLLSPRHHAEHHEPPFARRYCITTGWLDPLLDGLQVFPALERLLGRLPPQTGGPAAKRVRS